VADIEKHRIQDYRPWKLHTAEIDHLKISTNHAQQPSDNAAISANPQEGKICDKTAKYDLLGGGLPLLPGIEKLSTVFFQSTVNSCSARAKQPILRS
jgi:hypothetical protein